MTSPSPACDVSDLALIKDAALACGPLLRARFGAPVKAWAKPGGSPVTEIDLELDALIMARLMEARPDYGWLSEETPDTSERLGRARTFIVDPLDGTRAFLRGKPEFCVSIGLAAGGRIAAGVVYNPITEELFEARIGGGGARLNGRPIRASGETMLENSRVLAPKTLFSDRRWARPWPALQLEQRSALSYRLALVAAGAFDGAASLGYKNEWDIAAGAALVIEAQGAVSDPWGGALTFNQAEPLSPGIVAAGPQLHPLLIERLSVTPHPRTFPRTAQD